MSDVLRTEGDLLFELRQLDMPKHGGLRRIADTVRALWAERDELRREHAKCPEWDKRIVDAATAAAQVALENERMREALAVKDGRIAVLTRELADRTRERDRIRPVVKVARLLAETHGNDGWKQLHNVLRRLDTNEQTAAMGAAEE